MRYFISDCHFGHSALNSGMDNRGFSSVEEMNEYMISKWNSKIKNPNHEVVILGDFSMMRAEPTMDVLKRLRGKKILVTGNHDRYLNDKAFDRSLFKEITPYLEVNENKRKIICCHYPVFCYNGQNRVKEDGSPASYMLYGHVHNTFDETLVRAFINQTKQYMRPIQNKLQNIPCNMINCFCMRSDYEPLTLEEWIELDIKDKERA